MKQEDADFLSEQMLYDAKKKVDDLVLFENAAQQRALSLGGFFLATAMALAAFVANKEIGSTPQFVGPRIAGLASALSFYLGSVLCFLAAFPGKLGTSGSPQNWWKWTIDNSQDRTEAINHQLEVLEEKFTNNQRRASDTRYLFRIGAVLGLAGPLVGVIAWAITSG